MGLEEKYIGRVYRVLGRCLSCFKSFSLDKSPAEPYLKLSNLFGVHYSPGSDFFLVGTNFSDQPFWKGDISEEDLLIHASFYSAVESMRYLYDLAHPDTLNNFLEKKVQTAADIVSNTAALGFICSEGGLKHVQQRLGFRGYQGKIQKIALQLQREGQPSRLTKTHPSELGQVVDSVLGDGYFNNFLQRGRS
jgi:hypothetical protein